MDKLKNLTITPNASILHSLKIIDKNSKQVALVIDESNNLLGTLADGDIRRALLKGKSLNDTIEDIVFRNPIVCSTGDSKEKILKLALEKNVRQIPIVDKDGKLVGIEEISHFSQPQQKNYKVVLMVGGLGTRLLPLTEKTPKPMLQVGGKPILETIIANCKKYELTDIILSVGYKADIIKSHFGDGSNFGVNVSYINEDKRMGTAGALSLMRNNLTDYFFVMNGDILTDINFNHMLNFHLSNNAVATMAVKKYDFQVPYGVVEIKNQEIKRIKEKPTHRFFINAGLYLLSNTVLDLIPNDKFFDMPALFENLIKINKKAISFPIREYWLDIGRMEEFEKANKEYTSVF